MRDRDYRVEDDSVTIPAPGAPEKVGKPGRPRGEDERARGGEPGRTDAPPKGRTRRPRGTSTPRDNTSIDPEPPIDPDRPTPD